MDTQQNQPLVSVILCSYNAEDFIEPTLSSIIQQRYQNLEILILDNNSMDNTKNIIKSIQQKENDSRIKLFALNENLGAYKGLNYLLEKAKGKYIAIIDHDDIWHPLKIEKQVSFMEEHDDYIGCGGLPILYFEKNNKLIYATQNAISFTAPHPSLFFRFQQQRYDTKVKYKTDIYFMKYILCKQEKKIYNIQEYLYISRIRKDNKNLTKLWRTFGNVWSFYVATRDIKSLMLGMIYCIIPSNLTDKIFSLLLYKGKAESLDSLQKNDFLRPYLKFLN